jgi:hypothetical protein
MFAWVTVRCTRRRPDLIYAVFAGGALFFLALNVLGHHFAGFRVGGEPLRLIPELDLAFILAATEAARRAWLRFPSKRVRVAVAATVVACFLPALRYVPNAWRIYPWDGGWKGRVEHEITEWVAKNAPGQRALASGSVRFWYNAWFDLPQLGGGSEQGLLNEVVVHAQWDLLVESNIESSLLWLLATGVDLVIVHDKTSREHYHDYAAPQKFAGALPTVFDNGRGDVIYRTPRKPGLARVVDRKIGEALPPVAEQRGLEDLKQYVQWAEHSARPAEWTRESFRSMRIRAEVPEGGSMLVMENYDPYWRAYSGGRALPVRRDVMGFLLVDAPPGRHDVRLVFETPLENRIGAAATLVGMAVIAAFSVWNRRRPEARL